MEGRREERQETGRVGRGVEGEEEKYHAIIGPFAADSAPPSTVCVAEMCCSLRRPSMLCRLARNQGIGKTHKNCNVALAQPCPFH